MLPAQVHLKSIDLGGISVDDDSNTLSISEVAAATDLRPSALRYYEIEGLVHPITRVGGRRHYAPSVLRRLAIIALFQDVGFTVAEIKELLARDKHLEGRWRKMAEEKLTAIDAHIERARETRRLLEEAMRCGCGDLGNCEMVAEAVTRRVGNDSTDLG